MRHEECARLCESVSSDAPIAEFLRCDAEAVAEVRAGRVCLDCAKPVSQNSRLGRCRRCANMARRTYQVAAAAEYNGRRRAMAQARFDELDAASRTRALTELESLELEAAIEILADRKVRYKLNREIAKLGGKRPFHAGAAA